MRRYLIEGRPSPNQPTNRANQPTHPPTDQLTKQLAWRYLIGAGGGSSMGQSDYRWFSYKPEWSWDIDYSKAFMSLACFGLWVYLLPERSL